MAAKPALPLTENTYSVRLDLMFWYYQGYKK